MVGTNQTFDASDPRSAVAKIDDERQRKVWLEKRKRELLSQNADVVNAVKASKQDDMSMGETLKYIGTAFAIVLAVGVSAAFGVIWILDNFS